MTYRFSGFFNVVVWARPVEGSCSAVRSLKGDRDSYQVRIQSPVLRRASIANCIFFCEIHLVILYSRRGICPLLHVSSLQRPQDRRMYYRRTVRARVVVDYN